MGLYEMTLPKERIGWMAGFFFLFCLSSPFGSMADGPEFQNQLKQLNLPYDFKDRARLEKDLPVETEWYRTFLKKFGVKKES